MEAEDKFEQFCLPKVGFFAPRISNIRFTSIRCWPLLFSILYMRNAIIQVSLFFFLLEFLLNFYIQLNFTQADDAIMR